MTPFMSPRLDIYFFYNVQGYDSTFFITTLHTQLNVRVDILLMCGKHLHDRIISLPGEVWYICVLGYGYRFSLVSSIFRFDFGTVLMVWYFLFSFYVLTKFKVYGIYCLHPM